MTPFRAIWPITDETARWSTLIDEARQDLQAVAARAHVRIVGHGAFTVARSIDTPGSGRTTPMVLVWDGPAIKVRRRVGAA